MKCDARSGAVLTIVFLLIASGCTRDPLPSWNEGATKSAIVRFVRQTTTPGSRDFVHPAERIAVFDNDGTLLCEQPTYTQRAYVIDRVRQLAPNRPEWKTTEPFKSILASAVDDESAWQLALTLDSKEMLTAAAGMNAGVEVEEVNRAAHDWIASSRNPRFRRRHAELVYQPMLELLRHLRANGFKTYIVTGGGADFVRALAEDAYGIPPGQVLGVATDATLETRDGKPILVKGSQFTTKLDGPGKPVAIHHQIGRRPLMAFGNSDGDLQMLQYTAAGPGPRFAAIVHHTDNAREVAYDRDSKIGKLDKALDEARSKGWTIIDIQNDWNAVFPNNMPK